MSWGSFARVLFVSFSRIAVPGVCLLRLALSQAAGLLYPGWLFVVSECHMSWALVCSGLLCPCGSDSGVRGGCLLALSHACSGFCLCPGWLLARVFFVAVQLQTVRSVFSNILRGWLIRFPWH